MGVEENQSEGFPVGMRVLAVDDNPICLKVLDTLLRKCQYQVTITNESVEALRMLRENKNKFDLVISDVNMPDMDGFKLLELVGLEMDLPVIMLSAHSDTKLVMKGVTHGASDYLLKPVRIQELKNIWQHVLRRKRMKEKEEEEDEDCQGNGDDDDPSSHKRPRVVWSVELHRNFVAAVNQLGLDKAVPKKILDLMNVQGLTRENVASHLQKYRLYLKKATQQASMVAALGGSISSSSESLFQMGGIDGYADFCSSSGSGRIPSTTLPSYASGGIFSRLSSPAGLNLRGIASSSALILPVPVQPQNTIQPSMFPSNQCSSLLPGIPTSVELNQMKQNICTTGISQQLNQMDSSGFAVASGFPESRATVSNANSSLPCVSTNHLMIQGNSQQAHNAGAFGNQSSASLNTESFDTAICGSSNNRCNENWHSGAQLPKFPASSLQECDTFNNAHNSPADFSSGIASVVPLEDARNELRCQEGLIANIVQPSSFTPRQRWEGHKLNYDQNMSRPFNPVNSHVSLGRSFNQNKAIYSNRFDTCFIGKVNGASPSIARCIGVERYSSDMRLRSNDAYMLEQQMKSQDGFIQNFGTLDEIMGPMVKREQTEMTMMDGEMGFDAYPVGSCI